jgi:hypothetical protein
MTRYGQQYWDDLAETEAILESEQKKGDPDYTIHGMAKANRTWKRHNEELSSFNPDTVAEGRVSELMQNKWREVEAGAIRLRCTEAEIIYLKYRMIGLPYRDIERQVEGTRNAAHYTNIRKSVQRTYQRIVNAYPYMGLTELIAEACGVSPADVIAYCER